jgi:hypothetical protein
VKRLGEPESWTLEQCERMQRLIVWKESRNVSDPRDIRSAFCSPVLSLLRKVQRTLSSSSNDRVVWRMQFEDVKSTDTSECWRALSPNNVNAFKESLKRTKSFTVPNDFEPGSLRVAEYACSWHTLMDEMEGGNYVADRRRRFGNISPGSVVQALVADEEDLGRRPEEITDLRTPTTEQDFQSMSFQVTFWFVLGIF